MTGRDKDELGWFGNGDICPICGIELIQDEDYGFCPNCECTW